MGRSKRLSDEIRSVSILTSVLRFAEGSALIKVGDTQVLCAASIEEKVPPFLKGTGRGWVTAEYSMLPRSGSIRKPRESMAGRRDGRSIEIQRQIGRALRSTINLSKLGGERTIWIDCDVIQADGGTRTASITGGFVALFQALRKMQDAGLIKELPAEDFIGAISIGVVNGATLLDLDYSEDSKADIDMNVVMTSRGDLVEVQLSSERKPLSEEQLHEMLAIARKAIFELIRHQKDALNVL